MPSCEMKNESWYTIHQNEICKTLSCNRELHKIRGQKIHFENKDENSYNLIAGDLI